MCYMKDFYRNNSGDKFCVLFRNEEIDVFMKFVVKVV